MTRIVGVGLILGVALLSLSACQPPGPSGSMAHTPPESTGTFVNRAAPLGLDVVAFGQLAETKAADPAVRDLAAKIIADFGAINQQLAALAQASGMAPATDMDGSHQVLYHQIQVLNGPTFDRAYVNGQLRDLTMLIQAFQAEADSGSDPQVRSFAQQNLPAMLELLRTASAIASL